jgi:prolyl-tRNA synthetase
MKDLYSFDRTEEDLNDFYEKVKEAYTRIFDRAGIGDKTYLTFASGGTFSKYSHEFQTECENGEDVVYLDRKKKIAVNKEVYTDDVIRDLGLNKKNIEEIKAIEVGNIFKQMTKFSAPLDLNYLDSDGTKKPVITGAYGIGPARLMATVVELNHDSKGIIWPKNLAPFQVHMIGLNLENAQTKAKAEEVYKAFKRKWIDGEKFSDADLIGIPYRLVVSQKTGNIIELKKRSEEKPELITLEKALKLVHNS